VSDADRKDAKAALQAAVCYLQAKQVKQAGPFAMRAVELAPDDVLARRALLKFYESMGMELNASRERQALAKLRAT
jgi:Tfp pilus assembly protein PilF